MVSDMAETFGIEGVPDRFVDAFMTARHWWGEDDSRLLPGEEGGTTVFLVEFADGCRYCGSHEWGGVLPVARADGWPFRLWVQRLRDRTRSPDGLSRALRGQRDG